MKVLLINGSPHTKGNTFTSLSIMEEIFERNDIETEIYSLGDKKILPCTACGTCFRMQNKKCILNDDLNKLIDKCIKVDAIVLGSPVHFADISGYAKCAYDRLFYVSAANKNIFRHKVGASIAVVRRTGGMASYHQLNNYLLYSEMFLAGSTYWNVIYGQKPGQVVADKEGVQTLKTLTDNMVYLMKTLNESKITKPKARQKVGTNFVREDLL